MKCLAESSDDVTEQEDEDVAQGAGQMKMSPGCKCTVCVGVGKHPEQMRKEKALDALKFFGKHETEIVHSRGSAEDAEGAGPEQSFKLEVKGFSWLMHHLLPPRNDQSMMLGCPLLFPDTSFFDATAQPGRAKDIIKTDQNTGCLVQVLQEQKLNVQAIRTAFSLLVRERWKQAPGPEPGMLTKIQAKAGRRKSRRFASQPPLAVDMPGAGAAGAGTRPANLGSKGGGDDTTQAAGEKADTRNRDQVVLRFKDGFGYDTSQKLDNHKTVRGLSELEFISVTQIRANDPFWQRIECIQTTMKNQRGLGEHIFVPFKSDKIFKIDDIFDDKNFEYDFHRHEKRYTREIMDEIRQKDLDPDAFSYTDMQKEIERRMKKRDMAKGQKRLRNIESHYCQRIANKIAHYVQKVHDHDILRMDLDFFKDENDHFWLFYAKNIVVKNNAFSTKTQQLTGLKLRGQQIVKSMLDAMEEDGFTIGEEERRGFLKPELRARSPKQSAPGASLSSQNRQKTSKPTISSGRSPAKPEDPPGLKMDLEAEIDPETYQRILQENASDLRPIQYPCRKMSEDQMRQYRRIVKVKRLEKVIDELYEKQKRLHGIKTLSRSNEQSAEAAEPCLEGGAEARAMKDLERSILKELRPRLDPDKPLVDVIDTEKRRDEPPSYDDRVIKQLERKYGERPGVRPFGADGRDGEGAAGSFSPLSPLKKQIWRRQHELQVIKAGFELGRGFVVDDDQLDKRFHDRGDAVTDSVPGMGGALYGNGQKRLGNAKSMLLQKIQQHKAKATRADLDRQSVPTISTLLSQSYQQKLLSLMSSEPVDRVHDLANIGQVNPKYRDLINRQRPRQSKTLLNQRKRQQQELIDSLDYNIRVKGHDDGEESVEQGADEIDRQQLGLINMVKKRKAQEEKENQLLDAAPARSIGGPQNATRASPAKRSNETGQMSRRASDDPENLHAARSPGKPKADDVSSLVARWFENGSPQFQEALVDHDPTSIVNSGPPSPPQIIQQRLHTSQAAGQRYREHNQAIFKSNARLSMDNVQRSQYFAKGGSEVRKQAGTWAKTRFPMSSRFSRLAVASPQVVSQHDGVGGAVVKSVATAKAGGGLSQLKQQMSCSRKRTDAHRSAQHLEDTAEGDNSVIYEDFPSSPRHLQQLQITQSRPAEHQIYEIKLPQNPNDNASKTTSHLSLLLRKMYTPPVDPKTVPIANPFYNGQIQSFAKKSYQLQHQIYPTNQRNKNRPKCMNLPEEEEEQNGSTLAPQTHCTPRGEDQSSDGSNYQHQLSSGLGSGSFDKRGEPSQKYDMWQSQRHSEYDSGDEERRDLASEGGLMLQTTKTRDGNVVLCEPHQTKFIPLQRSTALLNRPSRNSHFPSRSLRQSQDHRDQMPWNRAKKALQQFHRLHPKTSPYAFQFPSSAPSGLGIQQTDASKQRRMSNQPNLSLMMNSTARARPSQKGVHRKSPSHASELFTAQDSLHRSTAVQSQKVINAGKLAAHKFYDYSKGASDELANFEVPHLQHRHHAESPQSATMISSPKSRSSMPKDAHPQSPGAIRAEAVKSSKAPAQRREAETPLPIGEAFSTHASGKGSKPLFFADRLSNNQRRPPQVSSISSTQGKPPGDGKPTVTTPTSSGSKQKHQDLDFNMYLQKLTATGKLHTAMGRHRSRRQPEGILQTPIEVRGRGGPVWSTRSKEKDSERWRARQRAAGADGSGPMDTQIHTAQQPRAKMAGKPQIYIQNDFEAGESAERIRDYGGEGGAPGGGARPEQSPEDAKCQRGMQEERRKQHLYFAVQSDALQRHNGEATRNDQSKSAASHHAGLAQRPALDHAGPAHGAPLGQNESVKTLDLA